jgi:GMP synthase-like glutamine amidotransferase
MIGIKSLNQGFVYKDHILALQFHLEVDEALVEGLLEHAAADLTEGDWVQTEEAILEGCAEIEKNYSILADLLEKFTGI